MTSPTRWAGRALAALVLVVTSTGCQAEPAPPEKTVAPPPTVSTLTASVPTASGPTASVPTAKASAAPSLPVPRKPPPVLERVSAGTVTDTRSASVSGSGPADIRFTTKGTFAVVVRLDCTRCRGAFSLTEPDRKTPHDRGRAPIKASYLTAVFTDDAPRQSVQLTATGRWKITLLSWDQLPVEQGRHSGKGSTVLFLGDRAGALGVSYRPGRAGDSFNARVFSVSGDSRFFGNDEPFDERYEVDLPAVVAIRTKGSWTLTPVG